MPRIPEEVIEEIKNRIDIGDVIGEYVQLKRKGDRLWGLSPFKNEKTPSFTVTPSKGMYYCYSTQKGGNVFSFLMEVEKLSFPEAVEMLAKKAGVDLSRYSSQEVREDFRKQRALEELYERSAKMFSHMLGSSDCGRMAHDYIVKRGFAEDTLTRFNIGYAPADPFWLSGFLAQKGYSPEFLFDSGLFSKKNPRWTMFANRLMFPISNHQGQCIGFGGRLLEGDGPKYINSPDTAIFNKRTNLYGLDQAKDAIKNEGYFLLCEGYLDVLAFFQAGIETAVAPLGTAFTEDQAKLLGRFAKRAIVVFDGDAAGVKAAKKAAEILEKQGLVSEFIALEGDMDPADILVKNGSQSLKNLVLSSTSAIEFLVNKAVSGSDIRSPGGKQQVYEQLFPYIRSMQSPIKQEESLREIADRLLQSSDAVMQEFQQYTRKNTQYQREEPEQSVRAKPTTGAIKVDRNPENLLMTAVTLHPQFFTGIRSEFTAEQFDSPAAKELFLILEEHFRSDSLNFTAIVENISNDVLKNYILKKASESEFSDPETYIPTAIQRVRLILVERRRREVEARIRMAERGGDIGGMRSLLEEKLHLDSVFTELKDTIHDRTAE